MSYTRRQEKLKAERAAKAIKNPKYKTSTTKSASTKDRMARVKAQSSSTPKTGAQYKKATGTDSTTKSIAKGRAKAKTEGTALTKTEEWKNKHSAKRGGTVKPVVDTTRAKRAKVKPTKGTVLVLDDRRPVKRKPTPTELAKDKKANAAPAKYVANLSKAKKTTPKPAPKTTAKYKTSLGAAVKAGDLYYMKNGKKMAAVTKEMLDKSGHKGKGALTKYMNDKTGKTAKKKAPTKKKK